ncbi:MAG: exodeoxyribonuclease VII small subunit [Pirellulales bacterium]
MTESAAPQNPQTPLSFEQALQRLEQIVQKLEDGRTDLGASLAGYEEGVKLLRQCHGLLERAERRIELLSGVDADGKPTTQAFDDEATISLEEKAQTRSKRRSTKKPVVADGAESGSSPAADSVDEPGSLF